MESDSCNTDINLLTKCSLDSCRQFIHKFLDGMCGRAPAVYTSFANSWSLEEWWTVNDSFHELCRQYYARGWTSDKLMEHLSAIPSDYRQMIADILTVRHDDVRRALVDKVNTISHASLSNFDWKAKLTMSNDRMANVWQPLLNVEFDLEARGERRFVQLELDRDELNKLVTTLESADRALSQLV